MEPAIVRCQQLQGKELSYNNILDADAALGLVLELPETAVCIIKHTNVIAPGFDDGALEVLGKKKALRLLRYPKTATRGGLQLRSVSCRAGPSR